VLRFRYVRYCALSEVLWHSSPYTPTLSYPVVLFLSSPAHCGFSRFGGCLFHEPHDTHDLDLAEKTSS
jgi:hypothetical protein